MKNNMIVISFVFIIKISIAQEEMGSGGHKVEDPGPVHQYIAQQASFIWTMNEITKEILKEPVIGYCCKLTDPLFCSDPQDCHGYDVGESIIRGTAEEDYDFNSGYGCDLTLLGIIDINGWFPSLSHFWNPDYPLNGDYNYGLEGYNSAYKIAKFWWENEVLLNYKNNRQRCYYFLGRVVHLLEDMTVPAHVHNDPHPDFWGTLGNIIAGKCIPIFPFEEDDSYENFSGGNNDAWSDGSSFNAKHFSGKQLEGQQYNYKELLPGFDWEGVEPLESGSSPDYFFRLFWYTAQKTQFFASDKYDGNDRFANRESVCKPDDTCLTFSRGVIWNSNFTIINRSSSLIDDDEDDSGEDLKTISEALIPHAMKAVAGLYKLFWDSVDRDNDGYSVIDGDCNDENASINPGIKEQCDGSDNNCDKIVDEGCPCPCSEWQDQSCGIGGCSKNQMYQKRKCGECEEQTRCVDHPACIINDETPPYCYIDVNTYVPENPAVREYISDVTLSINCLNDWRIFDIDGDGYNEKYLVIPKNGVQYVWFWMRCRPTHEMLNPVSDFVDENWNSLGCAYDGTGDIPVSKSYCGRIPNKRWEDYFEKIGPYNTPTNNISFLARYCMVEGDGSNYRAGWNDHKLELCYDINNNGKCDEGDRKEPNLIIRCGQNSDCPPDQYCYRPDKNNPLTYTCSDRCGDGICEPGENCPTDGQGMIEDCNGVDDDCDGQIDEGFDFDGDKISDCFDNCIDVQNPDQTDSDRDGTGDACEIIISTPNVPVGNRKVLVGVLSRYSTGGSVVNRSGEVEYRFDWGNGEVSGFGISNQSHSWNIKGVYLVKSQARSKSHADVVSEWSGPLSVEIFTFMRSDSNADGRIDISDPVFTLIYLYIGGEEPPCKDAADADDSGVLDLTDAVYTLNFIFLGGPKPLQPYPECGGDPKEDGLDCKEAPASCR